jgi:transposase
MAGWRHAVELAMSGEDIGRLTDISRLRTERASRVERAQMLLAYRENPSFCAVGEKLGVHHQTVQRCVERALAYGALAALDDRPRPGKEPTITPEAKAWLLSLACDKAKEHGYAHELWTTRLLARHAREHGPAAGHECLARLVQGTVCKILGPRGNQAAQGALLSGTPRRRVRAEDGGSSVCLPRGSSAEKGCCRQVEQIGQTGGGRLLR